MKLATSGVNPSDVKSRLGVTRKIAYPRVIPHSDGAGEIDMIGDGVPSERLGERVWVWNAQWRRPFGTCAEYVVLASEQAVLLPANTSFEAGADHAIDYKHENVGERVMELTGKTGVDAIIEVDFAANAKLIPHVLRPRGLVVIYGTSNSESEIPWGFFLVNALTLKYVYVYELTAAERRTALNAITRALEDGTLINNVGLTVPLSEIIGAHEMIEQGQVFGNLVVRTDAN